MTYAVSPNSAVSLAASSMRVPSSLAALPRLPSSAACRSGAWRRHRPTKSAARERRARDLMRPARLAAANVISATAGRAFGGIAHTQAAPRILVLLEGARAQASLAMSHGAMERRRRSMSPTIFVRRDLTSGVSPQVGRPTTPTSPPPRPRRRAFSVPAWGPKPIEPFHTVKHSPP